MTGVGATVAAGGHVAILGGGVIGGAWAARFALNGYPVSLYDPAPDAERRVREVLANARRALPMLYERALPIEAHVEFASSLEAAVEGARWVQESVPERLDLKLGTYRAVEAIVSPDTPIASSTSGFRPSELAAGASHPARILVAHPFNPVYLLPLVELAGGDEATAARASSLLRGIGMHPLRLRRENDAHIADRLLEAVWREALWLVRDGYASTAEIDDAIRYGFGLRWAQMGLFETYRIAGGEGGMAHFIEQFGPCLTWPWTKLTDVPELTGELVTTIASQSDAQSGHLGIPELERLRDDNLVAILRALKGQGAAAGQLIAAHEAGLTAGDGGEFGGEYGGDEGTAPENVATSLVTVRRTVPVDWTDYNGHMNEGRYGQVFSDAADAVLVRVGCDADYVAGGLSWFTAETAIRYLAETHAGERVIVRTRVMLADGKKLRLVHQMCRDDFDETAIDTASVDGGTRDTSQDVSHGSALASCEQFLLHVSLDTRKSCDPDDRIAARLDALRIAHATAPEPTRTEPAAASTPGSPDTPPDSARRTEPGTDS